MPFTDPMADGPGDPGRRVACAEIRHDSEARRCELVRGLRKSDDPTTPLVLMGYYNPIYILRRG